jgi:hypothetical protein
MFDKRLGRKAKATDALDELAFDANMIQRKQVCDKRMDKLKKKTMESTGFEQRPTTIV